MLLPFLRTRASAQNSRSRKGTYKPALEVMEDRQLPAVTFYQPFNLVSDQPGVAPIVDPNLVNAWGLSVPPKGNFTIAANGTDQALQYFGDVAATTGSTVAITNTHQNITIPGGAPTGVVFNPSTGFFIHNGIKEAPATFLFVSETGVISGWNPALGNNAIVAGKLDTSIFKGAAIITNNSGNFLLAADFHNGLIQVFDTNFTQMERPEATFVDPNIPAGYAPFNVMNFNGTVYVTYALQDANAKDDVPGPGHGFVDAFDVNGNFLRRVGSEGVLNSPWGMAIAPSNFGKFSNALLVGNFGDGTINAFDPNGGGYEGTLSTGDNHPIVIDGLWGLSFGNGIRAGNQNSLYFTAGPGGEQHGLFGKITTALNMNSSLGITMMNMKVISSDPMIEADVVITKKMGMGKLPGPITLFIGNLPAGVTLANSNKSSMGNFITYSSANLNNYGFLKVRLFFEVPVGFNMDTLHQMTMDVLMSKSGQKA
jgi:uncharacterized protein (TIGR03118 family)